MSTAAEVLPLPFFSLWNTCARPQEVKQQLCVGSIALGGSLWLRLSGMPMHACTWCPTRASLTFSANNGPEREISSECGEVPFAGIACKAPSPHNPLHHWLPIAPSRFFLLLLLDYHPLPPDHHDLTNSTPSLLSSVWSSFCSLRYILISTQVCVHTTVKLYVREMEICGSANRA